MSPTGGTRVWDLADASASRTTRRRGTDLGGPVAAALGAVALGGALAPGLTGDTRWCVVVAASAVAALVGFSAMRRRQALVSLLLAIGGLVLPAGAVALTADAALHAPAEVVSAVVTDATMADPPDALQRTAAFTDLPNRAQDDATGFATALVLRLRTLHGAWGPYPTSLRLSNGSVVEGPGLLQGTALGVVPDGMRLSYQVSTSGAEFSVTVVSTDDPDAAVTATSALASTGLS